MFHRLVSRRTLKWTGTIACVLLATTFLASGCFKAESHQFYGKNRIRLGIDAGSIWCRCEDTDAVSRDMEEGRNLAVEFPEPGIRQHLEPTFALWPWPLVETAPDGITHWSIVLPLWIPLLLIGLPIAWLWRSDHPRPGLIHRIPSPQWLRWTGAIGSTLLATVFIASCWLTWEFYLTQGTRGFHGILAHGCFTFLQQNTSMWRRAETEDDPPEGVPYLHTNPHIDWWPPPRFWIRPDSETYLEVCMPIWIPLFLVAFPTALLWWVDRRRPLPNHCRNCNYNLTGNTSGICPECATPLPTGESTT